MKRQIFITDRQIAIIRWALEQGLGLHETFLMHEDWMEDQTPKTIKRILRTNEGFKEALFTLENKVNEEKRRRKRLGGKLE